jgi:hypothetical protein
MEALASSRSAGGASRVVRWWRELIVVGAFYAVYDAIRGAIAGGVPQAQRDGADLLSWERWSHLDPEHAINNALQHVSVLAVPACYFWLFPEEPKKGLY